MTYGNEKDMGRRANEEFKLSSAIVETTLPWQ